ncbi:MAG TPA: sensor histidine kinase [Nitrososphaeraceae archaeon]|nr:sensor histidine kinase [Nitrososphaeraceae archaeon]
MKEIIRNRWGIRGFGILAVILIIISSYALFFYFQSETHKQLNSQLFEEQKDRQQGSTQQIANHMGSDLTLILSILDGISNSKYLQDGQFYGQEIRQLVTERYAQMSDRADSLFVLNNEDIVVGGAGNLTSGRSTIAPIGNDLSFRPWVRETHDTSKPVFSEGFEHLGEYRVIITNPVIDRETKQYLGLVGVSIPTVRFFEHYGNVYDINTQFLVALDKKGTLLAAGADQSLVGLDFFGETTQNFVNHNPTLNRITAELLQGTAGYGIYNYGKGERLTTYQPIYVAGNPAYFLQVVTPTDTIYSQIGPILSQESGKLALLLAGPTGASAILIIFLVLWNSSLGKEVKKRTKELQETNRLLGVTNEQLRERDLMQNEFINIAAHEMRTPIQPILGLSEIILQKLLNIAKQLQKEEEDAIVYEQLQDSSRISNRPNSIFRSSLSLSVEKIIPMVEIISRNAKRLEKLTNNLLDVTRIENNKSLELSKEIFPIDSVIRDCIIDASQRIGKKAIKFSYMSANEDQQHVTTIKADRTRIAQVLMNLLDNSINSSQEGVISVKRTVDRDANTMTLSVKDAGSGINPDITPRLFSKFATASEKGTGLGLYISKKIVEAHGGKIWAENNKDEDGATFAFTIPMS